MFSINIIGMIHSPHLTQSVLAVLETFLVILHLLLSIRQNQGHFDERCRGSSTLKVVVMVMVVVVVVLLAIIMMTIILGFVCFSFVCSVGCWLVLPGQTC